MTAAPHRIVPGQAQPLYGVAATRRIEQAALATLAPHTLMRRAGLSVARLAMALAPHARTVWLACGPGNNGGDGLEAAMHLQQWGKQPVVTWLGDEARAPADALASLARARQAGVRFADGPPDRLTPQDIAIDALLGIGVTRAPEGRLAALIQVLGTLQAPVLAVDVPSGLNADTGNDATNIIAKNDQGMRTTSVFHAQNTLSLLTCKPGLFTAQGRDAAGQIWWDDLGVDAGLEPPQAWLNPRPSDALRAHATHKGSFGDVAVVGGAPGMTGAALLAATAALHGGAGRVFVALLDGGSVAVDPTRPELMFRAADSLDLAHMTVVCGCGGGDAVRGVLPQALSRPARLVLDADALNAIAADSQLQTLLRARAARDPSRSGATVLTPHPLEAARLLGIPTATVQADRVAAAQLLVDRWGCTVVLKGSGTVVAHPGQTPRINPTGNARLATAGTGDVLAGMVGARLAGGGDAFSAAAAAVFVHGELADGWPAATALTAGGLAGAVR